MPHRAKYIYIIIGLRFFIFTISASIKVLFISSAFCFPTWQLPNNYLLCLGGGTCILMDEGCPNAGISLPVSAAVGGSCGGDSGQHPRMISFILLPIFILWTGSADSSDPLRQYLNLYFENEGSFQGFGQERWIMWELSGQQSFTAAYFICRHNVYGLVHV